jgi:hypothetical protein
MKNDIKMIIRMMAWAFVFGVFLAIGNKTMDHVWPDTPIKIEHEHKWTREEAHHG